MKRDPLYQSATQSFEKRQTHNRVTQFVKRPHNSKLCSLSLRKGKSHNFVSLYLFEIQRLSYTTLFFIMGNKRNIRLRRVEFQSPDGEENFSETSIVQGNATLFKVSQNVDSFFDRNLGSELTEPSQVSNEIEVVSQRLTEQNNRNVTK